MDAVLTWLNAAYSASAFFFEDFLQGFRNRVEGLFLFKLKFSRGNANGYTLAGNGDYRLDLTILHVHGIDPGAFGVGVEFAVVNRNKDFGSVGCILKSQFGFIQFGVQISRYSRFLGLVQHQRRGFYIVVASDITYSSC